MDSTGPVEASDGPTIVVHVIYFDPPDHPGLFVGRTFRIIDTDIVFDDRPFAIDDTLAGVRLMIPPGLYEHIPREPEDDPTIFESWS